MKKLKSALKSQFLPSLFTIPLLVVCALLFDEMDMLPMAIVVMWPVTYLLLVADKVWDEVSAVDLQLD